MSRLLYTVAAGVFAFAVVFLPPRAGDGRRLSISARDF